MDDELIGENAPELLSLQRMATRVGVPSQWLRKRAEAGDVPGLLAGERWLFRTDLVLAAIAEMAARGESDGSVTGDVSHE